MDYIIKQLSNELVYIRWYTSPPVGSLINAQFLHEIDQLLVKTTTPLFFISDLRDGRIIDVRVLQQLAEYAKRPQWAGSTAFSKNPITALLVRSFKNFARVGTSKDEMQTTPEQALVYLESLKEGLTQNINWDEVLSATKGA